MPTFEIDLNGKTFEVDAPDMKAAAAAAQKHAVSQHPWNQFNAASRAGQRPEPGKEFPGGGYVPTKTEAAKDVGMLGAMLAAGPAAEAIAPAYPVLAPAIGRTLTAAAPDMLTGDFEGGLKKGAATAGVEALMSALGLPSRAFAAWRARGVPQPAVHQAANFQPPVTLYGPTGAPVSRVTPPITFNRVNPGAGPAPTVHGGGPTTVTPNQVIVQPPSTGAPITGGGNPAAILQEPLGRSAGGLEVGQGVRTAADMAAAEHPDAALGALSAILSKVRGLNPFRSETSPYGGYTRTP